jgi:hypothetical protein
MLELTHFQAAAIFAFFTSIVFAIITKDSVRDRVVYGAWCFAAFLGVVVGLGWLMKLAHG